MNPSANSSECKAGDLIWHSAEAWTDKVVLTAVCSGPEARTFHPPRQPDWEWENAMILSQQTANGCGGHQEGDYRTDVMQAEAIGGISSLRRYEDLLPAPVNHSTSILSPNTWGLLSAVGVRDASPSTFQGSSDPYCSSLGPMESNGYLGGNGLSLYGDPRSNLLGLFNIDQRRLEDVVKRELCTTNDVNARIGLNLGGRTYFSVDDYEFGMFCKRPKPDSPGVPAPLCQADGCKADLSIAKHYHRRHRVCELHSKAPTVLIEGLSQRFCQQCSRFHGLSHFDDGKRSCRERLADHNRRRRKQQRSVSSTTDQSTAGNPDSEEATKSKNNQNGLPTPTIKEQTLANPLTTTPASTLSQEDSGQMSTLSERNDQ